MTVQWKSSLIIFYLSYCSSISDTNVRPLSVCLIYSVRRSQMAQQTGAPNRTTAPSNLSYRYNICKCKVTGLRHSLKSIKYEFSWNKDKLYRRITLQIPSKESVLHNSIRYSFTDVYTVEQIITSRKAIRHESRKIYSKLKWKFNLWK